jgi:hypothetical protein
MARIARSSVRLVLPANTPLTPRTFNEVIKMAEVRELLSLQDIVMIQRHVLLSDCSVPLLESKIPVGQLVFLPQHTGPLLPRSAIEEKR